MKVTKEEKLKWLVEAVDRSCHLQVSHPHLAWYPTKQDREMFKIIKADIERADDVDRLVEAARKVLVGYAYNILRDERLEKLRFALAPFEEKK